jgi:lipopolysaccharide/colanic/teichoic acid biosynthesis glycosyltransferase
MEAEATFASASVEPFAGHFTPILAPRSRRAGLREPAALCVPRSRVNWANRIINVLLSATALLVLSPVLVIIAVAIRSTSRGSVLYTQQRVGFNRRRRRTQALYDRRGEDAGGVVFTIYKFRTMRADAEKACGAVWATHNDPRVTSVGRILRKYRLDELPQLFNVIRGDMNIVGPRPERPTIFAELRSRIEDYHVRQRTRPGITGWAQVNNAYDASLDDVRAKVRFDLEYIERQSLLEDVKIMLRTVPVMLFRRGGW